MENRTVQAFFRFLQDNPSTAAGACTFAVAFALIAGNAILAQPGKHPVPIWATRDLTTTRAIPVPVSGEPEIRAVKTVLVRPKTVPVPTPRAMAFDGTALAANGAVSSLVLDIQTALVATGDYRASPDGKYGPFTREAILSYQRRNGLKADGEASAGLLKVIRLNDDRSSTGRLAQSPDPVSRLIGREAGTGADNEFSYDSELVKNIQKGLANFGEADITVDGIFGKATSAAIADFQRKYKLEVTGKPDEEVLRKLRKIGAFSQG